MTNELTYAWIFAATARASAAEAAGLRQIIGAADYIDHAIPTREELQMSLGWLIAHGLIQRQGQGYQLTSAGHEFYAQASAKFVHLHQLMIWAAKEFAGYKAGAEPEPIAIGEFQVALNLYYQGG